MTRALSTVGCLALLWLAAPTSHAFDSQLFSVQIQGSAATKAESGNIFDFDRAAVEANAFGPALFARAGGIEFSETFKAARSDGPAKFGLALDTLTQVKLMCRAQNPSFSGTAQATGNLETYFEDGLPYTVLFSSLGTGSADGTAAFQARKDLNYPTPGQSLGTTAAAVSSGDVDIKEISGEVTTPFGKVTITPKEGEGKNIAKPPLTGNDSATLNKSTFEVDLRSYTSLNIHADDSGGGAAVARAIADINQTLNVTGSCSFETTVSGLALSIDVPSQDQRPRASNQARPPLLIGKLDITTVDRSTGAVIEDIHRNIRDDGELLYLSSEKAAGGDVTTKQRIDTDWGKPAPREATFSAAAARPTGRAARRKVTGRLGVNSGFSARYAVRARGSKLRKLRRYSLRVAKIKERIGELTLATKAELRGGRTSRARLPENPFRADGELRGFFIPVGLKVGDRFWARTAKVVGKTPEVVRVRFRQGRVRARATYDADTGSLRKITERARGGVVTKLRRTSPQL